jgi:tRNA-splicing ligase RtcB
VGYDINCGVRVLASNIPAEQVKDQLPELMSVLYKNCPSGLGKGGHLDLSNQQFERLLTEGAEWALDAGYAQADDLARTEEGGRLEAADPGAVSQRAWSRGIGQVGTLGSGNHFIEVDVVERVFDEQSASAMGLAPGNLAVQIHCGSRGFGHQVCTDYVKSFQKQSDKYGIKLPDRQLICAPYDSTDGQAYYRAMCTAANYAFVNRQVLAHYVRRSFEEVLSKVAPDWQLNQVYDIAHNMAKVEKHQINGDQAEVVVHRKGATRAFGPGFAGLPEEYQAIGQPVLVPGSMGTSSWILVGTEGSMGQTFGSSCHGAGRTMSRTQAKKTVWGEDLRDELEAKGIVVRAGSMPGLAEEAPRAYKDVDEVVGTVSGAGIARKVSRLIPAGIIKG